MGLTQARNAFFKIRNRCPILVKNHAFRDYPERGFSQLELMRLVKVGNGRFTENNSDVALKGSYLFYPKDEDGVECKLVILLQEVEVEGEGYSQQETVIVCSAYRER
ncbi:MAG: hypothetical protein U0T83_07265 [Bacteriovoracaceae bacterium]